MRSLGGPCGRGIRALRRFTTRFGIVLSVGGLALTSTAVPGALTAQSQGAAPAEGRGLQSTRQQLEAMAARAESAGQRAEAALLNQRLREGDFLVGDRILVTISVASDSVRSDTLTVRSGKTVSLPSLPPISLEGVLRAELADVLAREMARYVRDPKVEAKSLIRVLVTGPVGRPGFYQLESDILLSDAIMIAGGPGQTADLDRTVIRRDGQEIRSNDHVRAALRSGSTLDQLNFRPGDEIVVGIQRQGNVLTYVQLTTGIVSTVLAVYFLSRRF